MIGSPNLTGTTTEQIITQRGMAYFAGTGPAEKTCKDCAFFGYKRTSGTGHLYHYSGCRKYYEMTYRHGGEIIGRNKSCKCFEQKT